ncbi:MAG: DNA mismatch repair endonuclease MutL [Deltaproteobacteria bacterium]|nr:DNA mismatch repair endonuclease MutL [Deltaproteobacteria bacterium]
MPRIQKLHETVANQVAAGEVIERPASVVKELVENAVDAGARRISIEVQDGGVGLIRIVDDGMGMDREDAVLCLERHATSKIRTARDIESVATLGFRGEAVPSIASVSRFLLVTRTAEDAAGTRVEVEGGHTVSVESVGAPVGTAIDVKELFFNLPARRKFLKRAQTEASHVDEAIERIALAYPHVAFRATHDGRSVLDAPVESDRDPRGRLGRILGAAPAKRLHAVDPVTTSGIRVSGFVGAPDLAERTARGIRVFVNGRFIRDRTISHSIQEAYRSLISPGRQPVVVLKIDLPAEQVDVNAHPQKLEVRFANPHEIHRAVTTAVARTLAQRPWLEGPRPAERTYSLGNEPEQGPAGAWAHRELADRSSMLIDQPGPAELTEGTPSSHAEDRADSPDPHAVRTFPDPAPAAPVPSDRSDPPMRWAPWGSKNAESAPAGDEHRRRIADALAAIGRKRLIDESKTADQLFAPQQDGQSYYGGLDPLGQALGRYLVCQAPGRIVLIDQEAAHRRVLVARLIAEHASGQVPVQSLLIPLQLELDRRRAETAHAEQSRLRELGFLVEPFGGSTWVVKGLPARIADSGTKELVLAVLDDLGEVGQSATIERVMDRVFSRAATHSTVRAGDRLSKEEIKALLADLDAHQVPREDRGRPISVEWSDRELDRLFARRVLGS